MTLSPDSSLFLFNKYIQTQDKLLVIDKLKEYCILDENITICLNTLADELSSFEFKDLSIKNERVSVFSSNEKSNKKLQSIRKTISTGKEFQSIKIEHHNNPFIKIKRKLDFDKTTD